jgi:hypothetical protein
MAIQPIYTIYTIYKNKVTLNLTAGTNVQFVITANAGWNMKVKLTGGGGPDEFASTGSNFPTAAVLGNLTISGSSTVELELLQQPNGGEWITSNLVTALTAEASGLSSLFFAGRDDGGASRLPAFPNVVVFVYYCAGL